ncbi:hypothetical protein M979_0061 [Buttiauxella noackiae ATCC 51607]|uniref:Uncharacterized protein n=1 Tax=Buttiauxella noackiae ATCC 51607 TaxID=1354255 RepID=A0A1B7I1F9_9ENTR|nr:hypothetical protein M979_0061 [Buttiauxella noackiae ATCC 51607]
MNTVLEDGFLGDLWIAQRILMKIGIARRDDLPDDFTSLES